MCPGQRISVGHTSSLKGRTSKEFFLVATTDGIRDALKLRFVKRMGTRIVHLGLVLLPVFSMPSTMVFPVIEFNNKLSHTTIATHEARPPSFYWISFLPPFEWPHVNSVNGSGTIGPFNFKS